MLNPMEDSSISYADQTLDPRSGTTDYLFGNTSSIRIYRVETDPPFLVNVNGVVSPLLVLITVTTNCFICLVLLKPHMRSPTNALLVAIALTDALTGLWPLPCYVFFYSLGNCFDWVPFEWCGLYPSLSEYLPTITHTASIWLTVLLAVQRYVCVCHSQTGRRWFSRPRILADVLLVLAAATLTHVTRFFESTYVAVSVTSRLNPNVTMTSCARRLVPFVERNVEVYFSGYFWFRVVFINLVPCASLLVLNVLLILTLRSAQERKARLLGRQRSDSSSSGAGGTKRWTDGPSTTLMLVLVVGLFLLVEFPLAVLFIVDIIQNTIPSVNVMSDDDITVASHVVNLAILFSYPFNFFIYCSMSRQFRDTFAKMFRRRKRNSSAASLEKTECLSLAYSHQSPPPQSP